MITESFPYFPISNIISHIAIGLLSISFLYYVGEYFPSLIHRKKRFDNIFLAEYIGHRGSRDEGLPENTIAAFRDAINKGAEVIELDVWLSKDQKVNIDNISIVEQDVLSKTAVHFNEHNYYQADLTELSS
jgi:hypothetical protein